MSKTTLAILLAFLVLSAGCKRKPINRFTGAAGEVTLITLDPGHFHAGIVQAHAYPQVSPDAYVYAPDDTEVEQHLDLIHGYNSRAEDPTRWNEIVYTGDDFLRRMLTDRPGNVVVLAGKNHLRMEYIKRSVNAGMNVLADKPLLIDPEDFHKLERTLDDATWKGLVVYDMMTFRHDAIASLQCELTRLPELFGTLRSGTPEEPGVEIQRVHNLVKQLEGEKLMRPAWYFDVEQQGDGLTDAVVYQIDHVQQIVAGEKALASRTQIAIASADRWSTSITPPLFQALTGEDSYPGYLQRYLSGDTLRLYCNGRINYTLNGIHCRVTASWEAIALAGVGNMLSAIVRGTRANVIIRQGAAENYKAMLYVENAGELSDHDFFHKLKHSVSSLAERYSGIGVEKAGDSLWRIVVPDSYYLDRNDTYGAIMRQYLGYLVDGIPAWEVSQMKAKYYTTTKASEIARDN